MLHLRWALRTLIHKPLITIVAVMSLALGTGANVAIFSMFNQALLRRLPVPVPSGLVTLSSPGPKTGHTSTSNAGGDATVFSYPMFRDLERLQTVFTGIAGHREFAVNLAYRGQTLSDTGLLVSGSYFPVLGLRPFIGRLLMPDDDRTPGSHHVVVLSHTYWRSAFGESPAVLNDTLIVNGQPMTIVGVTPPGFEGTTLEEQPKIFVAMTMSELMRPAWTVFENRRDYWIYLLARLKPGVSVEEARAAINAPYRAILNEVELPLQTGISDRTREQFKTKQIVLADGSRGEQPYRGELSPIFLLLFCLTGTVVLIACANIANLLLARTAYREREIAIRLAVGASRGQLIMQLLTESWLLACLGSIGGLIVAFWTLDALAPLLPAAASRYFRFELDFSLVLFTATVALITGLLFGFFPALHGTRPNLASALKAHAGQSSSTRPAARFRTLLATGQIALSMALLVVSGLFIESLVNISRVDLGFPVADLTTFRLSPELNGYTPNRSRLLFERAEDELTALPGLTSVSASSVALMAGNSAGTNVSVQGFIAGPDADTHSMYTRIGPNYFRTIGIPLIAGREFTRSDAGESPKVGIVNEAFARKFNLGREAVGKRMGVGRGNAVKLDIEIVGVVRDAKYSQVKEPAPAQYFLPYRQNDGSGSMNFYIRSAGDAEQFLPAVPRVVAELDAQLPVENLRTMTDQVRERAALDRLIGTLASAFAGLATLLAAVGLYGVLAYTVAQRTREIGVRVALGADMDGVRLMVLRQVGWMILVGVLIGTASALALARLAQSLLFELKGADPLLIGGAALTIALVALGAGIIPAHRASQIDPMLALRSE